ncbi:MAG: hypothetical protein H5T96_01410 [Tissierellales bacterium]|nr:hypothetical protein [Tissierellales bacterium]
MKIGSDEYNLMLIDTNIIRELLNFQSNTRKGFFHKAFLSETKYAPCFSIYNVIELMPYNDLFEKFVDIFSEIPCLMLFTAKQFIEAEYDAFINGDSLQINCKLANSFTPVIDNESYNLRKFINRLKKESSLITVIQNEVYNLPSIANEWEKGRREISKVSERLNEKDYLKNEARTLLKDIINWGINPEVEINVEKFPALRIMAYSQFMRVHLTQKKIKPNDVLDVLISSAIPYVDAVLTENYQADIYKKAKKHIRQLGDLEILTLKDIRVYSV